MIYSIPCDFDDEEFSLVGKFIWACTVLEHELARGAMWLNTTSAVNFDGGPVDNVVKRTIKGTLRGRYSDFKKALRATTTGESYLAWISENEGGFQEVSRLRDLLVHGKWRRGRDGSIECMFHDRQSVDSENEISYEGIPVQIIEGSTDQALALSISIVRISGLLD